MAKKRGLDIDEKNPEFNRGQNHLLAIAVNDYEHAPKLSNCVGDAQAIIDILISKYDFESDHVTTLFDQKATRANIYKQLRQLASKVKSTDNLLVYFAGHGIYDKEGGSGYLVPVEAAPGNFWDFVSNGDFLGMIRAIKSFHTFLLMDSCFSGTLFRSMDDGSTHLAENVEQFPSRWGLAAGRIEEVEDGWHGENSPFAKAILQYLEANDSEKFPVSELVQYTKRVTPRNARQTPIGGPLFKVGDMDGEFVFYLKKDEELPRVEAMKMDIEKGEELLFSGEYRQARRLFNGLLKEVEEEFKKESHKKALIKRIETGLDLCKNIPKYKPYFEKGLKKQYEGELAEAKKKLAAKDKEIKQLQQKLEKASSGQQTVVDRLKNDLAERKKEITTLKRKLTTKQKELDKLQISNKELKKKNQQPVKPVKKEVDNSSSPRSPLAPELVRISRAKFYGGNIFGSSAATKEYQRRINLKDYYLAKFPVTLDEFSVFVNETQYKTDVEKVGWAYVYKSPTWSKKNGVSWRCDEVGVERPAGTVDFPVLYVSWNDAQKYCEWLSKKTNQKYRLPTEDEWEYAAKGGIMGKGRKYAGSNQPAGVAWHSGNSDKRVHPVGRKKANELLLHDMSGNIFEWCQDWYSENLPDSALAPPLNGSHKVIRGGSWYTPAKNCLLSYRTKALPDQGNYHIGFRIARDG